MLHLALAALLAATPFTGSPDGDKDKDKDKVRRDQSEAVALEDETIVNDTYAFGSPAALPLKLWVGYGYGEVEDAFGGDGQDLDEAIPGGFGQITSQRAFVGAQINFLNLPAFSVGVGGQLTVAKNEVEGLYREVAVPGGPGPALVRINGASDFTLQNAKVYGVARGRVLGIHGGYIFDLGPEGSTADDVSRELQEAIGNIPEGGPNPFLQPINVDIDEFDNSDEADAWFVGASFDYPGRLIRVFGGIDYFNIEVEPGADTAAENAEMIVFNSGLGLRIAFVEIGAAALLRTNLDNNVLGDGDGGFQGSIAPYLVISPRSFPVALSVKGAVLGEYADYGYSLGGNDDYVTEQGFTVALTLGF